MRRDRYKVSKKERVIVTNNEKMVKQLISDYLSMLCWRRLIMTLPPSTTKSRELFRRCRRRPSLATGSSDDTTLTVLFIISPCNRNSK